MKSIENRLVTRGVTQRKINEKLRSMSHCSSIVILPGFENTRSVETDIPYNWQILFDNDAGRGTNDPVYFPVVL